MNEITTAKRSLRIMLLPFVELFDHKRTQMTESEWRAFIEATKIRVLQDPGQFFGNDLPETSILNLCIEDIFSEIISEQNIVVA
jgi:hypothetical protein